MLRSQCQDITLICQCREPGLMLTVKVPGFEGTQFAFMVCTTLHGLVLC